MIFGNHFFQLAHSSKALGKTAPLGKASVAPLSYDPELLYVECQVCGKPVLWEEGKTTELLEAAEIDLHSLDNTCMLVSDGCPHCHPEAWEGFTLSIVRLAGVSVEDALHLLKPGGNA